MKKLSLTLILLMLASSLFAASNKITSDLQHEMDAHPDAMHKVIIVMNEQFEAKNTLRQVEQMGKQQRREFMVNELQRISDRGQRGVLDELQRGQRAATVDDIQSYWIVNAISCSMTKDGVEAIAQRPDVKYVMKSLVIYVIDGEDSDDILMDRANNQWNVTKVNADDVWALGYTGQGVIVAIIDTGVRYTHTDIANNMWDGGTDYPHHGWDFVNNDNDPMDDHSHGTHCAGTVSSYGTNGSQCGIAKDATIMALKVLGANGEGDLSFSWSAIQFAVSHGADVLSMSLGSDGVGGYWVERMVMENVLNCGVVASVAAGNTGNQLTQYPVPNNVGSPGNCPSPWHNPDQTLLGGRTATVTVGATTNNDTHSYFSSYGPVTWASGDYIGDYNDYPWTSGSSTEVGLFKPDIAAPGSNIVSLNYSNNTGYTTKSGTSMATPCVAGVMALMLQVNPMLTPMEIDSIIETTAVRCGGQTKKNNTFGAGRIDALAAVNYMLNACNAPTNLTASVDHATVDLAWTAASGVSTYQVYRNGSMIANNVATTHYTDEDVPSGLNTYYVRSNGSNHQASIPSNRVTVNVTTNTHTSVPTQLVATSIDVDIHSVTLGWNAPETRSDAIAYTLDPTIYDGVGEELIAAQKYPASTLQDYAGMQIEHVYFGIYTSGSECTVSLYEGDAMTPGMLLHQGTMVTTEDQQWVDYVLPTPVVINPNKDLWLTVATADYILENGEYTNDGTANAFYYRFPSDDYWFSDTDVAWVFALELRDGDYSYNLYKDDAVVATGLSATNYADTFADGTTVYQVTAVTNGYESDYSNAVSLVSQIIPSGSNWWTPTVDITLEQLEAALGSNATLINSQDGGFAERNGDTWSGTLSDIQCGQMYKIQTDAATTLTISGSRVDIEPTTLVSGYNWIGYTGTQAKAIGEVFSVDFAPVDGDTISSATQSATFQGGQWTGELITLQPGQGYVYFSNTVTNRTIVFH